MNENNPALGTRWSEYRKEIFTPEEIAASDERVKEIGRHLSGPPDLDMTKWTKEQLDAEIEKGYQDMLAGRATPIDEVFEELRREGKL